MRYGSVCSGIEAASVAWETLGWTAAWFSEIEKFPSTVLAERWPLVPNIGDMRIIAEAVRDDLVEAPEILVGGTPCQAFSVAGLRKGLDDKRGQLTLSYVELANAIDDKCRERGEEEAIIVWENVPGVLSSKDNAFGCFLAGLAGESCELQPVGGKWTNAGCVSGPQRAVAWRVLDAQFFGVAQRRRRVFVVASARKGFDPSAVLFEPESLRRGTPPGREERHAVAALTARGVGTCGADDNQGQAGHLIAQGVTGGKSDTLDTEGADASEEGTGRVGLVVAFGGGNTSRNLDVAACLTAKGQRIDFEVETFAVHSFNWQAAGNTSATPGADEHLTGALQASQQPAIAVAGNRVGRTAANGGNGLGCKANVSYTLTRTDQHGVAMGMQVRRLTPRECERLKGVPDDYTLVPYGRDYRRTLAFAGEGDVVYCDPPYEPLPGTSAFTDYSAGGFKFADQVALAESCVDAHLRGAKIVKSNSTAPKILELYKQHNFRLHYVNTRRAISCKGSGADIRDIIATLGGNMT